MTINLMGKIRQVMGWCPSENSWTYKPEHAVEFAYPPINPINRGTKSQSIQSGNVIFPADTSMFSFILILGFPLVSLLSRYLDFRALLTISITIYVLCYFIIVKSYQSSICIDEKGIRYNSFWLRNFTLNFGDIRSIKSVTWVRNKYLNNPWILLALVILIMAISVLFKEWIMFIWAVPSLPVILLLDREYKRRYHDLDTQLYIESTKNKWWYVYSPYYPIITDKNNADRIRASIEQNIGGGLA